MKIIFLDIDGVCNSEQWYRSDEYYLNLSKDPDLDPHIIERLNQFTNDTGVKLVISSSWKYDNYCLERLTRAGLNNIVDSTPNLIFSVPYDEFCKGIEIRSYLDSHPEIERYLILDDEIDDILSKYLSGFLLIDPRVGITEENINFCKEWFNNG
jgi:hypothetical protein